MKKNRVVVTGIGILSPIGNGVPRFYEGLKAGENGIDEISAFDTQDWKFEKGGEIKEFEAGKYFPSSKLDRMDRASAVSMVAAREAVERAGIDFEVEAEGKCGVMVSTTLGGTISAMDYYSKKLTEGKRRPTKLLDYPLHSVGARISQKYNISGPNVVLSTACSSGNVAIGYAADLIRSGRKDVMFAAGVDTMAQLTWAGFGILRNVSPNITQPFDKNREGLILGEASAVLILEELEHAKERNAPIFGEISGRGLSSDATDMTAPDQSGNGPAMAIQKALDDSGVESSDFDYINAHGTGTKYNDMIETKAIKKVFGDSAYDIPVSSTKSMIGHTLGACGVVEAVVMLLAINENFVPPTINYETPDPECDLDYVPNDSREATVQNCISNTFGFGGNNCSLVVEEYGGEAAGKDRLLSDSSIY